MKKIAMTILGALLILISLWGGAYFLHIYSHTTWQNFPIFMTAFFSGIAGGAILAYSLAHDK